MAPNPSAVAFWERRAPEDVRFVVPLSAAALVAGVVLCHRPTFEMREFPAATLRAECVTNDALPPKPKRAPSKFWAPVDQRRRRG